MRIVDILSEELIIPELRAGTRDEVLAELVDHIVQRYDHVDRAYALRCLIERERIGSTGIGNGIAIPHAKLPELDRAVACFARSSEGVDFKSLDGRPAHLFLALLAPESGGGLHLKALARASRLLKDETFIARVRELSDAPAIWSAIVQKDNSLATG